MKKIVVAAVLAFASAVVPIPAFEAARPPRDLVVLARIAPDGGSGQWTGSDPETPATG